MQETPKDRNPSRRAAQLWSLAFFVLGSATVALHWRIATLPLAAEGIPLLLACFGAAFLAYLGGIFVARRLRGAPTRVVVWVFLVAAASMAAHWRSPELLSSEVNRYRWDGLVAREGFNPYEVSPADPELAALRASFPDPIPAPTRSGLYPPLAELLFYGMARLDRISVLDFRVLFSAAALLAGLTLIPLCRAAGVPTVHAAFLLWHPLLILETAGNAHLEALGLFFLLASLALLFGRHQLTPLAALALSVLTKAVPVALLPLYIRRIPPYRLLLFLLLLILGSLPFLAAGPRLLSGFLDLVAHARFNPGPFLVVEKLLGWLGHAGWARGVAAAAGLVIALALTITDDGTNASILRRAFYLALPPILLGPVVNPWYLIWILPFLALLPREDPLRMPLLFLSGSVALAYLHLAWGFLPGWVTLLEYAPVGLLFLWGLWRRRSLSAPGRPSRAAAPPAPRPEGGC